MRGRFLSLMAVLYIGSLVSANYLAAKLAMLGTIHGITIVVPAAVLAYSLTFTATDIIGEVYGKRAANDVVMFGLPVMGLVITYNLFALHLRPAPFSPAGERAFHAVVGTNISVILGSVTSYVFSQTHDVWAYHFWMRKTNGKWLWLRNNASTLVSQLIDTVIFLSMAFVVYPAILGGHPMPIALLPGLILGQYIVKAIIALLDTPIVYGFTWLLRWLESRYP